LKIERRQRERERLRVLVLFLVVLVLLLGRCPSVDAGSKEWRRWRDERR